MTEQSRVGVIAAIFGVTVIGWATAGYGGTIVGIVVALALLVAPWKGLPAWVWAFLRLRRNRRSELTAPITVSNDRSGGGVRFQDGVAIIAIQLLGKPHRATMLIGSTMTHTENTIDVAALLTIMNHNLGLDFDSVSVVSAGSRRRNTGDYPRVYDTFIGTSPYAGNRETWLVLRICAHSNAEALQSRTTVGSAALAATQRVAAALCCSGVRARVATATEMTELDRRLGGAACEPSNRRWHCLRGEGGWLTSYGYDPTDITTDTLALPWSLRVDGVVSNITLFADRTATASVTIRTAQPPTASPSVTLRTLPGRQTQALSRHLCGPLPALRGLSRGPLPESLRVPVGSSGVLLGKVTVGDRLLLPLEDPAGGSQVHIAADDPLVKRIIVRAAAAGGQVTVHTTDIDRWSSIRMPNVVVTEQVRPAAGTTISVVDGTVLPAPRPNTVLSVGQSGSAAPASTDVVITQTGPASVEVRAGGLTHDVEMELFRAENRYAATEPVMSA
ncbi:MAG: type VII secretion protein EccE [Mycobacterium sp.]